MKILGAPLGVFDEQEFGQLAFHEFHYKTTARVVQTNYACLSYSVNPEVARGRGRARMGLACWLARWLGWAELG